MTVDLIAETLAAHDVSVDHFRRRGGWCWWCSCETDGEGVHDSHNGARTAAARHQAEHIAAALAAGAPDTDPTPDTGTAPTGVDTRVSRYSVCAVPETVEPAERYLFEITVEDRGTGWAVLRHRWCLGADGEWDFEPLPSERDDEWHPADAAAGDRLRRDLVATRRQHRLSQRALAAALGTSQSRLGHWERHGTDLIHTLHRWASSLDLALVLTPTGLCDPAPPDVETAVLAAMAPTPETEAALLLDHLRRVRVASGLTLREMSTRLGHGASAAANWEWSARPPLLGRVQRWTRALGGELHIDLEQVEVTA